MRSLIEKVLALPHGDKILHAVGGAIVGVVALLLGSPDMALVSAGVVGAIKEIYDSINRDKHTPDFLDFLATAAGGGIVQAVYYMV